ncbi:helix-turn-helix domain-containing protein [Sinomicrobium pectinilyticum]|uniref:Bacteriophage CI repressor N-terminal domain-containing protein n=1 Tax=Sinomicrobium pectinilyticum TaxID=1084421 RepID=A0A3N0DR41_SINP1|nr:helix-turn-helix domain-containing protein [Sinomicrobium pectinilyticum]RNL77981.1 hypothetical protein ED312_20165 [Sinomicrobium pectinilyticum]
MKASDAMDITEELNAINCTEDFNAAEIMERLKKTLGIRTDVKLSKLLGIESNTLSTWKARNSLNFRRIITVGRKYGLDLNILFSNVDISRSYHKSMVAIPREYQYQYVNNRNKDSFINEMPRYNFPYIGNHNTRAFQVLDFSLFSTDKGTSYAIGEWVGHTEDILNGEIYILVNRTHGVFIGRVDINNNIPGTLFLINEDAGEMPYKTKIYISDIVEIWKVYSVVFSRHFVKKEGASAS